MVRGLEMNVHIAWGGPSRCAISLLRLPRSRTLRSAAADIMPVLSICVTKRPTVELWLKQQRLHYLNCLWTSSYPPNVRNRMFLPYNSCEEAADHARFSLCAEERGLSYSVVLRVVGNSWLLDLRVLAHEVVVMVVERDIWYVRKTWKTKLLVEDKTALRIPLFFIQSMNWLLLTARFIH